jgi:hypothetical protein
MARYRGLVPDSLSMKFTSHSVPLVFNNKSAISALPFHAAILEKNKTVP